MDIVEAIVFYVKPKLVAVFSARWDCRLTLCMSYLLGGIRFFKEVTSQPKIFLDCSRCMIESANVFPQKVMKVLR